MADSRRRADEVLALAIAAGRRVEDAAREARMSSRTVTRRLNEPKFMRRVREIRAQLIDRMAGQLADGQSAAVKRLLSLVESADERIALQAAKAAIELRLKTWEVGEVEERLRAVEDVVRRKGGKS